MKEPFPAEHCGLLTVRRRLEPGDQLGAVPGGDGATNRTRRWVWLLTNLAGIGPVIRILD